MRAALARKAGTGLLVGLAVALGALPAFAQKYGGELKAMLRENWPSLSIHEEGTISTVWPLMPAYSNLVLYDPARATESTDHLIGELAESWSWSQDGKKLTFKLRQGVTWHDGKPFTSRDVKHTFDMLRGVGEKRLRLNPRKLWYENVQEVATNGDFEASFVLKKPQPSLLAMLASGYTPIYPAHVDPAELRTREMGTGPFIVKTIKADEEMLMERNPNYFVKGRPYLDAIRFIDIKSAPTRYTALAAGQLDLSFPGDATIQMRDLVIGKSPQVVVTVVAQGVQVNLLLNNKKAPFDNMKVRQAVNLAMDRPSLNKTVYRGALLPGGTILPPPYGEWGLPAADVSKLPGWGDSEKNKAEARKLLADAGYGPGNPLKLAVQTRAIDVYVNVAIWVIDQLKQVGIEGTLEQYETGVWHPKMSRGDYLFATNLTGVGPADPDADYFENYTCASQRNYMFYCNKELEAQMLKQSEETDKHKRMEMVRAIDRQLQTEAAKPILGHLNDYFMHWPYVKGLVPHNNIYNFGRMQEVWLDK
jgi:peptide/nickel transport system substrate-binding protein